jgi:hypothetical protein
MQEASFGSFIIRASLPIMSVDTGGGELQQRLLPIGRESPVVPWAAKPTANLPVNLYKRAHAPAGPRARPPRVSSTSYPYPYPYPYPGKATAVQPNHANRDQHDRDQSEHSTPTPPAKSSQKPSETARGRSLPG